MAIDPADRQLHLVRTDQLDLDEVERVAESRAVIEQAKGILMERYQLDPEAAFAVLVRHSQHSNRKLRTIAEELVGSGILPEDPSPRG